MPPERPVDVAVAGDGPAGLALAAACADHGLRVTVVAREPDASWPNRYGVWPDELVPLDVREGLSRRWSTAVVDAGDGARHLARGYGLLDNDRTRSLLISRLGQSGEVRPGEVEGILPGPRLQLAGGAELPARLVVDATGHRPVLLEPAGAGMGFQSAWGIEATPSASPGARDAAGLHIGAATLMDLRDPESSVVARDDPTFLYAMDLGGGRWFLEETSLARRAPLPFDELERRLRARLSAAGVTLTAEAGEERCVFPMGAPVPSADQPVLGYGAAAAMVHPATGYQVGGAMARAPAVAAAIADALAAPDASPADLVDAGWAAVWSRDRRRQHELHRYGLATLLGLRSDEQRRFFATFFGQPEGRWRGYLSGAASVGEVQRTMLGLFVRGRGLRRALLRPLARSDGRRSLAAGVGLDRR